MSFEDLKNPELQEKLKAASTVEDLVALAKEEGVELADDQLDTLSGGEAWYEPCQGKFNCNDFRK